VLANQPQEVTTVPIGPVQHGRYTKFSVNFQSLNPEELNSFVLRRIVTKIREKLIILGSGFSCISLCRTAHITLLLCCAIMIDGN